MDQEFDGKMLTPYDPGHNSSYLLAGEYRLWTNRISGLVIPYPAGYQFSIRPNFRLSTWYLAGYQVQQLAFVGYPVHPIYRDCLVCFQRLAIAFLSMIYDIGICQKGRQTVYTHYKKNSEDVDYTFDLMLYMQNVDLKQTLS